jgi:putative transposase
LALNQDQPIGNDRFCVEIQAATGKRRELRKRGRPRMEESGTGNRQDQLELPF